MDLTLYAYEKGGDGGIEGGGGSATYHDPDARPAFGTSNAPFPHGE